MEWYKTLDINQRINLKDVFHLICGLRWEDVGRLISMRDRIDIVYNKLKMEGFDI